MGFVPVFTRGWFVAGSGSPTAWVSTSEFDMAGAEQAHDMGQG